MGLARQALDAYLLKLNTYPLRMQLITGTMIGYAGDAIAQVGFQIDTQSVYITRALMGLRVHVHQFKNQYKLWIEKAKKYDFSRGTRMAAFRFFLLTPLENRWMIFAERKFTGRTLFNLTKKVSIDQLMIGPILMICFFTYNEGELLSLDDAMKSHSGALAVFVLTY